MLGAGPGTCMGPNSLLRLLDRGQRESWVGRGLSTFLPRRRTAFQVACRLVPELRGSWQS